VACRLRLGPPGTARTLRDRGLPLPERAGTVERIIDIVLGHLDADSLPASDRELAAEIQQSFNLTETELELMKLDCGTDRHIVIHRLDLYTGTRHHILEFNTDSAAGILETDIQIRLFKELSSLQLHSEQFLLEETDGAGGILKALLDTRFPGKNTDDRPAICRTLSLLLDHLDGLRIHPPFVGHVQTH